MKRTIKPKPVEAWGFYENGELVDTSRLNIPALEGEVRIRVRITPIKPRAKR